MIVDVVFFTSVDLQYQRMESLNSRENVTLSSNKRPAFLFFSSRFFYKLYCFNSVQ